MVCRKCAELMNVKARVNQPTFLEDFAVQEYTALRQCFYKENRVW